MTYNVNKVLAGDYLANYSLDAGGRFELPRKVLKRMLSEAFQAGKESVLPGPEVGPYGLLLDLARKPAPPNPPPKREKLIRNRIRCRKCGDEIESFSVHDFKYCKCGACFIDGGHEYCRYGGNLEDIEPLFEYEKSE